MYEAKHQFPRGYKTWRILNEMSDKDGMTYGQIIKYAYEMSHGAGTFDKRNNRGYWSGAFVQAGPGAFPWSFKRSSGPLAKYAYKGDDGKYRVSGYGKEFIMEYTWKFGDLTHSGAMEMKKKSDGGNEKTSKVTINDPLGFFEDKTKSPEEMAVAIRKEFQKETSPEVRLRGFQLEDKVAYRKTDTGVCGITTIVSIEYHSKKLGNKDAIRINTPSGAIYCEYDDETKKFYMHSGYEIEIIKI